MLNHHLLPARSDKTFPRASLGRWKNTPHLGISNDHPEMVEYLGPNPFKTKGKLHLGGPMYKPKTVKNRCVIHYTCTKITKYVIIMII